MWPSLPCVSEVDACGRCCVSKSITSIKLSLYNQLAPLSPCSPIYLLTWNILMQMYRSFSYGKKITRCFLMFICLYNDRGIKLLKHRISECGNWKFSSGSFYRPCRGTTKLLIQIPPVRILLLFKVVFITKMSTFYYE